MIPSCAGHHSKNTHLATVGCSGLGRGQALFAVTYKDIQNPVGVHIGSGKLHAHRPVVRVHNVFAQNHSVQHLQPPSQPSDQETKYAIRHRASDRTSTAWSRLTSPRTRRSGPGGGASEADGDGTSRDGGGDDGGDGGGGDGGDGGGGGGGDGGGGGGGEAGWMPHCPLAPRPYTLSFKKKNRSSIYSGSYAP